MRVSRSKKYAPLPSVSSKTVISSGIWIPNKNLWYSISKSFIKWTISHKYTISQEEISRVSYSCISRKRAAFGVSFSSIPHQKNDHSSPYFEIFFLSCTSSLLFFMSNAHATFLIFIILFFRKISYHSSS